MRVQSRRAAEKEIEKKNKAIQDAAAKAGTTPESAIQNLFDEAQKKVDEGFPKKPKISGEPPQQNTEKISDVPPQQKAEVEKAEVEDVKNKNNMQTNEVVQQSSVEPLDDKGIVNFLQKIDEELKLVSKDSKNSEKVNELKNKLKTYKALIETLDLVKEYSLKGRIFGVRQQKEQLDKAGGEEKDTQKSLLLKKEKDLLAQLEKITGDKSETGIPTKNYRQGQEEIKKTYDIPIKNAKAEIDEFTTTKKTKREGTKGTNGLKGINGLKSDLERKLKNVLPADKPMDFDKFEDINTMIKKINTRIGEIEKELIDPNTDQKKLEKLKNSRKKLTRLGKDFAELKQLKEDEIALEKKISDRKGEIEKLEKDRPAAQDRVQKEASITVTKRKNDGTEETLGFEEIKDKVNALKKELSAYGMSGTWDELMKEEDRLDSNLINKLNVYVTDMKKSFEEELNSLRLQEISLRGNAHGGE